MTYHHATFSRNMPSILANGLGASPCVKNWRTCEDGVYLARSAVMAASFVVELAVCFEASVAEGVVVIVVEDSMINQAMLMPDPNIRVPGYWIYRGVIDVSGARIMSLEEAFNL